MRYTTNEIYRVYKKYRDGEISRKLSISEKNVSDKSCRISKDLFTGAMSLTLDGVAKVRARSPRIF